MYIHMNVQTYIYIYTHTYILSLPRKIPDEAAEAAAEAIQTQASPMNIRLIPR